MNFHLFLCGPGLLFENRSINAFGIKSHIGIKFHTVHHAAVLCVVDNEIQADPLDRIFHAADLDGAGQVSAGSSSRSALSSLTDQRIRDAVGKCAAAAQFFFAQVLCDLVRFYDCIITPSVMAADILIESESEEPVAYILIQRMGSVVAQRDQYSVLRIIDQCVQISTDLGPL